MKGVRNALIVILFIVFAGGNYAYSDGLVRSSCKHHKSGQHNHGPWTEDTAAAIMNAMGRSFSSGSECWVDQKRTFLHMRMPSKRFKLNEKQPKKPR